MFREGVKTPIPVLNRCMNVGLVIFVLAGQALDIKGAKSREQLLLVHANPPKGMNHGKQEHSSCHQDDVHAQCVEETNAMPSSLFESLPSKPKEPSYLVLIKGPLLRKTVKNKYIGSET